MQSQTIRGETPLAKPEGGYVSISTFTAGLLWWAFTEGLLTLRAVRVGLALFELRIRRGAFIWTERKAGRGAPDFVPNFSASEIAALCGLPSKRVNAALKELLDLGVLAEFSPEVIRFARYLSELRLSGEQRSAFRSWLAALTKRNRVPVPRRVLVLAAESSSRALVAVILGVCLRCSWLRPGEGFSFTGRVSCRWLSRRFKLSLRAIENAKAHLVGLGFVTKCGNVSRFGELVAINPAWHRLASGLSDSVPVSGDDRAELPSGTNSAGVKSSSGTNSAGVFLTQESLPTGEIQNPRRESPGAEAPRNPGPGVFNSGSKREFKTQDRPVSTLPPPRLSSIRPEDFKDVGRALELFRQAVKCGLMANASEHSKLIWLAAIERARTVPARNPAGVFLHVVKGRKWDYLSEAHFEAANARLKKFLHAPPPGAVPMLVPRPDAPKRAVENPRPSLSKDALLVRLVREKLNGRGSVFAALHAHAGWDRERYVSALAELEQAAEKRPSLESNAV